MYISLLMTGCLVYTQIYLPMECELVNESLDLTHALEGADAMVFSAIPLLVSSQENYYTCSPT